MFVYAAKHFMHSTIYHIMRLLFPNFLFLQFWNCAEIRIVGSGSSEEEEEYIPELQEATLVMEEVEAVVGW